MLISAFGVYSGSDWLLQVLLMAIVVTVSIICHELAHGYVALANGDNTAKLAGRLTFNPVKHFDLIGFLMLMTVGFGYAKPVPVNPYNYKNRKVGAITVSAAGVVTNFLIAFICGLFANLLMLPLGSATGFLYNFLFVLLLLSRAFVLVNVSLMLFNLLPLYPLDGYRLLEGMTRITNPITKFLRNYGSYILWALFLLHLIVNMFLSLFPAWGWMMYLDPLGMYIGYVGGYVQQFIYWFWGLMF